MSKNQMHGKQFEDIIKSTFSGSSDNTRKSTSKFDIEKTYDKDYGLDTSIKTTAKKVKGTEIFWMSDARRIFSLSDDFRLIIGLYEQIDGQKRFVEVIEYIIKKEDMEKLKGNLSHEEVEEFHNKLGTFESGKKGQKKAQLFCKKNKCNLQSKTSITLNPKIDSKKQRRLQCSIKRKVLESILPSSQIIVHSDSYRNLALPIAVISGTRQFNKKE